MVVVISDIAVACSLAPVACWLAAACSSADELCTWRTAEPICSVSERVMSVPTTIMSSSASPVPHKMVWRAVDAADSTSSERCRKSSCSSPSISFRMRRASSMACLPAPDATSFCVCSKPAVRRSSMERLSSPSLASISGAISSRRFC
jgi:hypothetical protein